MRNIRRSVLRFLVEDDGPTTPEYAVLISLLVLGVIVAIEGLREAIVRLFGAATEAVQIGGV